MVSCDTRRLSSLGYCRFSHPEICSGDQSCISLLATRVRSLSCRASRQTFGRKADCQAWESASLARYCTRPPWRATSRFTVELARLRCWAMTRMEQPLAIPREMSSRSANVSARPERRRTGGAIPPCRANRKWMTCLSLPSARPIAFNDCPAFQRLHISARWPEDSFHRLCIMNNTLQNKIYIRWCCIDRLSRHAFQDLYEKRHEPLLLPSTRRRLLDL